jgi:TDG/mug DNA glycosylase family protein
LGAYRIAFTEPKAQIGPQEQRIGETLVWVLPNPSGLNAYYQQKDLVALFMRLKTTADSLQMNNVNRKDSALP